MGEAVASLLRLMADADPYGHGPEEIGALQLAALEERFQQRRSEIAVLGKRAADVGVSSISALEDVVPLLFAHTTYKSYPERWVDDARWDRMNQWLATLSTRAVEGVALDDVADVDDWLGRLHDAGHFVFSSSGTTGKCSFLDQTAEDRSITARTQVLNMAWATGVAPAADRDVFLLGPRHGYHRFVDAFTAVGDAYGGAGQVCFLSDEPATVADANRMGAMRRAIAQGTATPAHILAFEDDVAARQVRMQTALERLAGTIFERRAVPMVVMGMWSQHFALAQLARAAGVPDGGFHPETVVTVGGGTKGVSLPPDYEEQVRRFYGLDERRYQATYGMSELSTTLPACGAGRYHCPPWVVPLVVDKHGESLQDVSGGAIEGRMAFFDVSIEGRWGGLISGDRVVVDGRPCPCGRPSVSVLDVARYTDLAEGDDKLTCAGTMEGYVRGMVGDP